MLKRVPFALAFAVGVTLALPVHSLAATEPPPAGIEVDASPRTDATAGASYVGVTGLSSPLPARPTTDIVALANWWRSFAGRYPDGAPMTPLVYSAQHSEWSQRHVDYLAYLRSVGSQYCDHGTEAGRPPLDAGNRTHNVLFCGVQIAAAVDGWMETPLHGYFFVRPENNAIGYGQSSIGSAAGFQTGPAVTDTYTFPKPGGIMPMTRWLGGESPDPSALCPPLAAGSANRNGPPIHVFGAQVSYASGASTRTTRAYKFVGATLTNTSTGAAVPACAMTHFPLTLLRAGDLYNGSAFLFPQAPLQAGAGYRVTFDADPVVSTSDGTVVGNRLRVEFGFTAVDYKTSGALPRIVDTRSSGTSSGAQVAAGATLRVPVSTMAGIAASTPGVALSIAAVDPRGRGFVTVWPCDAAKPVASTINFDSRNIANVVLTRLGTDGTVCVSPSAASHLIVDVVGTFGGAFTGTTPSRILETRPGAGLINYTGAKPAAGQTIELPTGVTSGAVTLNLTAVDPDAEGYLTVWPCDTARPVASNLNFAAGQNVANAVVVRPSTTGKVCIYTSVATYVLVDRTGSIDSHFSGQAPKRVLETRAGAGQINYTGARPVAGQTVEIPTGAPAGTAAVSLNLTAVEPGADGYVTVWPCGTTMPTASNSNYGAGRTVANLVIAQPGANGKVCVFTSAATHLVADVLGVIMT